MDREGAAAAPVDAVATHHQAHTARDARRTKTHNSVLWVFLCAPGRAHLLGGESPLPTRQGEGLAEGKGVSGDRASGGSRKQNAGLTNRKRIRGDTLG